MRINYAIWLGLLTPIMMTRAAETYSLERGSPVPADEPVPALDFFRPAMMHSLQMNRAGTHVAAIVSLDENRMGLGLFEIEGGKRKIIEPSKTLDVYRLDWMGDEHVLFSVAEDNRFATGLYTTDLKGKTGAIESYSATEVIGIPRKNPRWPIVWIRANAYDDGSDGGVLQLDAKRLITRYDEREMEQAISVYGVRARVRASYSELDAGIPIGFLADKDGELSYGVTARDGIFSAHYLEKRKWTPSPLDLDEVTLLDSGDRPYELIGLEPHHQEGPRGLVRIDARSGEIGESLFRHPDYDLESVSLIRHPSRGDIIGVKVFGMGQQTEWFEPELEKIQSILEKQFRGQIVSIIGIGEKLNKFLIATYSDRQPAVYHTLDWKAQKLALFNRSAPWIDPQRTQPMQLIQFKSRDGHRLEGLLTLPAGTSKTRPAPLIAYPHGGPWAADSWGWDPSVQFLVSRGYAVFQPNYRGSTGYDWKFPGSDLWDFKKMHDDVTDGVRALLSTGLIDSERVAIMGGSFGGYLSMAGVTREPELYQCAITIAGVFDWELMMNNASRDRYETARYQIYRRMMGDPAEQQDLFDDISPIKQVANITVPVMVAHGREDQVVSIQQSKRLVKLLEQHDVEHTQHFVSREGHSMTDFRNQIDLFEAIERFLAEHL